MYVNTSLADTDNWQKQMVDSESVNVWTKPIPGSDFKAFKGEVIIHASVASIFDVVTDHASYPEWYHKNKLTKKLKKLGPNQSINYAITNAPWPVSNRDSVTLSTQTTLADGSIKISLEAKPDAYPLQEGMIRITQVSGYWKLEKQNEQKTKVTLQISAEPGGDIPSWLANSMVIDMPLYTLTNLKARLENQSN